MKFTEAQVAVLSSAKHDRGCKWFDDDGWNSGTFAQFVDAFGEYPGMHVLDRANNDTMRLATPDQGVNMQPTTTETLRFEFAGSAPGSTIIIIGERPVGKVELRERTHKVDVQLAIFSKPEDARAFAQLIAQAAAHAWPLAAKLSLELVSLIPQVTELLEAAACLSSGVSLAEDREKFERLEKALEAFK